MGRVARIGVLAAASGALAVTLPAGSGLAAGGAGAEGSAAGSPGLVSGNTVQLPVDVCGNFVNVAGLLSPDAGDGCENAGDAGRGTGRADAFAEGGERDSPGVLSGNGVRLPVSLPVNVSGNAVSVVGVGDPSVGNESANGSGDRSGQPPPSRPSRPEPPAPSVPETDPRPSVPSVPETEVKAPPTAAPDLTDPRATSAALARTGAGLTVPALLGGAALVLGGAVLFRRFRPGTGDRPAGTVRRRTDRA
ncbi:chaplin [Streptomyces sp. ISL-12]|uniref:chaplin n=1 Tax=Streptomyces sp. ISL-12 TaxID=2819177 RepID=UPI001BE5F6DE|nr:chaplin [Streptomyces sp. ISL-12]MBT2411392.1 chaplin [Streptomyces sp. ISL-12]